MESEEKRRIRLLEEELSDVRQDNCELSEKLQDITARLNKLQCTESSENTDVQRDNLTNSADHASKTLNLTETKNANFKPAAGKHTSNSQQSSTPSEQTRSVPRPNFSSKSNGKTLDTASGSDQQYVGTQVTRRSLPESQSSAKTR